MSWEITIVIKFELLLENGILTVPSISIKFNLIAFSLKMAWEQMLVLYIV